MPEVASIFNGVQVGVESTPGTSVAANKLLNYMELVPDPALEFNTFRPMGQLVDSVVTPGQDSMVFSVNGAGTYSELIYPFCSLLTNVTPSTVDTSAKLWDFIPLGRAEDTIKTYTVEFGSSTRAQKSTYGLFTGIELAFNRTDGVTISGNAIGQQIQDNITLTASPTAAEDKPILPTHLDVYIDSTSAGLGTTKLLRDFDATFRYNDKWGSVWPLNSANASFATHVNQEPTIQMELTMAADSTGMGYLTNARAGDTRYIRLAAVSTELAGASTAKYQLLIDMAGKISDFTFDDVDGIKVARWTFNAIYDAAWGTGRYVRIQLQNKTSAL